jgi:hypothetical protein
MFMFRRAASRNSNGRSTSRDRVTRRVQGRPANSGVRDNLKSVEWINSLIVIRDVGSHANPFALKNQTRIFACYYGTT